VSEGPPEKPTVPLTAFDWELGKWDFDKPGAWLLDQTGRGSSALYPNRGYSTDFFGPIWDGSVRILIPDAERFNPRGPFTITVEIGPQDNAQPWVPDRLEHVISRGDPKEHPAFDVAVAPGGKILFAITDDAGESSVVEGPLGFDHRQTYGTFLAMLDPTTGDQWLFRQFECTPIGHTVTRVRPAAKVSDNRLHLIEGFRGRVKAISIERGLMMPSGNGTSCSFQLSKFEKPKN
jgi:hypothetical protein